MSPQYVSKWFRNNIIYRGISVAAILLYSIKSSTPLHYGIHHAHPLQTNGSMWQGELEPHEGACSVLSTT